MKQALGHLIKTGREHLHLDRPPFLEALKNESRGETLSPSALKNVENGKSWPRGSNALMLEKVLRWRDGTIQELMERGLAGEDLSTVTLEDVTDRWAIAGIQPATKGSQLSTDELLAELTHRVKAMQAEIDELEATGDRPAQVRARQGAFGLAAYDLPGEKERGMGKLFSEG
jgi:uncharacterized small protein (DUF1192 family)